MPSTIPDVPGTLVTDEIQLGFLRDHVRDLCQISSVRFPGSQPISFNKKSVSYLLKEDYWVCEKSDGQRVLVLIVVPPMTGQQEVYLIDRKNMYYRIHNIVFPHYAPETLQAKISNNLLTDTLLDGELVIDHVGPDQTKLRLLLFDCIICDGENITRRDLGRRYARLRSQIYPSYKNYLKEHPDNAMMAPFEVLVKPMDLAYGIEAVLKKMEYLQHGNDGLIFTSFHAPYVYGTNNAILKWKPPHENTIDFKIELRFPPDLDADSSGETPDYTAKPMFQLFQHVNGMEHEPFDWLNMSDEEWERWKESGEQLDDRIVECAWHAPSPAGDDIPTWHIKRIRDDKTTGNHKSTVSRILQSMKDGVVVDELLAQAPAIRTAWKSKERENRRAHPQRFQRPPLPFKAKGLGPPKPPVARGGPPFVKRR
ncbi:mrna guanylyltransferase [Malassezia pachydermatis]|uniref:mRNA-capping enzyme subunit alpha n=1 Tax=Malassezia pachydermatis TaxID=77020 RepID=A0A0M8ML92_9BASI|nr:mrna guanylyltransferase [Malassezia pachydermatis]KOS13828.1 mrna guanylyltransferase [Malassezia pachydermatis]